MLKLNLLLIFSSALFFVPTIHSENNEKNCYLFWKFVRDKSDGTFTNALRGIPLNTSKILTIDDIYNASSYNLEMNNGFYTYTFNCIEDVVEVNYTCPWGLSGKNYTFRNNVSEINRTGLERFVSFDIILSNYQIGGNSFKYWVPFEREGFNSSVHYGYEDFENNSKRNGFTVMTNDYMTPLQNNDKIVYVFNNSDPTSTVVRFKIDSRVGSEYTALATNYTDKTTQNLEGCRNRRDNQSSIDDNFFQTDFAKTKTAGLANFFDGGVDFIQHHYGRVFIVNKDSENSSFPIFVDTSVGCPQPALENWKLIIKPFDRSFPTRRVNTGTSYENTEKNQNAYYIIPTEFEDDNEKFAITFALIRDDYHYWRLYIRYLPHENFCPQLDQEALDEFYDYRSSETDFADIAYPNGCLKNGNYNIEVRSQSCNQPLTDYSKVLFGSESQINEQDGLFVFWERKGNEEVFAVYSCDSIIFSLTTISVEPPNEVHLDLTENYIVLQNSNSSMFDVLFADDDNTGLFYKTVQYENFCPYFDPNLNLANASNLTLRELVYDSKCTSQGDFGINYSGKACFKPAQEANFSLSGDTLKYTGEFVNLTFLSKTGDSSTDLNVFYSCDGGVLYQSLVFKKTISELTIFIMIMAVLGALTILMMIIIFSVCCLRNKKTERSSGAVVPAANIKPPKEQILASADYEFK